MRGQRSACREQKVEKGLLPPGGIHLNPVILSRIASANLWINEPDSLRSPTLGAKEQSGQAPKRGYALDPGNGTAERLFSGRDAGRAADQFVRAAHVLGRGLQVSDGDPQRISALQFRVRQECPAIRVDLFKNCAVERFQGGFVVHARRVDPEADDGEGNLRQALEVGIEVDPAGQVPRQPDMPPDSGGDALGAEKTTSRPQGEV
jgi:hypothetical protein